jgi:virulence-associated protein VagC
MITAQRSKVFVNNQTYAVNIPPEFNFQAEEIYINKIGDVLMMTPVSRLAETLERGAAILASYSEDFMKDGLPEEIPAVREEL